MLSTVSQIDQSGSRRRIANDGCCLLDASFFLISTGKWATKRKEDGLMLR